MRSYAFPMLIGLSLATPLSAQAQTSISREALERFNPADIRAVREAAGAVRPAAEGASEVQTNRSALERLRRLQIRDPEIAIEAASPGIELDRGEYLLIKSMDLPRSIACSQNGARDCVESEFRFVTTAMEDDVVNLSLVWESTRRLRFAGGNAFTGDLFVRLRDLDAPNVERRLSGSIQVVVAAPVDEVEPGEILEFERTNRFQQVRLSVRTPQQPTLVTLTPATSADSHDVTFEIDRPQLELGIGGGAILGFGLETARVSVRAADGAVLPAGADVSITSLIGRLDLNDVPVDAGRASTYIRSRGTGTDTITASSGPFADATANIEYERPWTWLIAVLAGALVGITIRLAMRAKAPDGGHSAGFNIAIGLTGGFVTAVLYALGVNILPFPLPGGFTEGATFVLSALGGWVFPKWLSALAPARAT